VRRLDRVGACAYRISQSRTVPILIYYA
jgi:hypothetical protein